MSNSVELLEFTRITKAREVDEERGILHDLVALGPSSENGRDYPETTMREALHLFEGKQSYANHHKGPGDPSVYDVLGVWKECRIDGGKVRGNFHYFLTHPLAGRLVEAAKRPELNSAFGFSINARGRERREGGRGVIEGIDRLTSIDCVGMPATTKGLHESKGGRMAKLTVKELQERLKDTRPSWCRSIKEMAEAGILSPTMPMDDPGDSPTGSDHKQAILDACKACIDDDALDVSAKVKKIKKLLKVHGDGDNATEPDADDDAGDDDGETKGYTAAEESVKKTNEELAAARAENAKLKTRESLRATADEAGVRLSKSLLESVRPDLTEAEVKALVADEKAKLGQGGHRARSATPAASKETSAVTESKKPLGADDIKAIARRVNGRG